MEDEIGERRERGEREGEDGDRDEGTEPRKAEQNCNKMTRLKLAINHSKRLVHSCPPTVHLRSCDSYFFSNLALLCIQQPHQSAVDRHLLRMVSNPVGHRHTHTHTAHSHPIQ